MYGAVAFASRPYAAAKVFAAAAAITIGVAIDGGGASQVALAKGASFGVTAAGGGAAVAGLVKSALVTVAASGGGASIAGFAAGAVNLFSIDLPGSRIIDGAGAVPGIAAATVQTITIKPVGGIN